MTGTQISTSWAVMQAAESLAASPKRAERRAGRSLRCCEVVALERLSKQNRQEGTQGVQVRLQFYSQYDLKRISRLRRAVEVHIARALGLWENAIQLDAKLIDRSELWLGSTRPSSTGGTGRRLDRYLTDDLLESLDKRRHTSDWQYLAEYPAEVRILLRRLRYRLGQDYGASTDQPNYSYWTTGITKLWADQNGYKLEYLVHRLSRHSDDLVSGHADAAYSLDVGYWGEVNTEKDPLIVSQITTRNGTTMRDANAVFDAAGDQLLLKDPIYVVSTNRTNRDSPLDPFIRRLRNLIERPSPLRGVDVLFIHRGGGVNPTPENPAWDGTNVTDSQREELLSLCSKVRDLGIEVVMALGHANISILDWKDREIQNLPLGIFEATTPTAGAAWILQEHINPRLIDTYSIYSQELAT